MAGLNWPILVSQPLLEKARLRGRLFGVGRAGGGDILVFRVHLSNLSVLMVLVAPEVIQMGMDVTTAADIWSFACTASMFNNHCTELRSCKDDFFFFCFTYYLFFFFDA